MEKRVKLKWHYVLSRVNDGPVILATIGIEVKIKSRKNVIAIIGLLNRIRISVAQDARELAPYEFSPIIFLKLELNVPPLQSRVVHEQTNPLIYGSN
jgi:hypothetical protein